MTQSRRTNLAQGISLDVSDDPKGSDQMSMEQGQLLPAAEALNHYDFIDAKDVADFLPEVQRDTYYIFPTGGPHYFSQCTCEVLPIYKENIWPFIYRKKRSGQDYNKNRVMLGSIGLTKLSYIWQRLYSATDTKIKRNYRRGREEKHHLPKELERSMHRIVATCFIPNDDPEKNLVDHINGNRVDYRIDNLRWVDPSENSRGTPGGKNDPNEIYNLISEKDWFNGKSSNTKITSKDKYFKQMELKI